MPTIAPVSDLRNYGVILDKVKENEPVYLTKNGYGVYSIRKIEDEEKFQKALALLELLTELTKGYESGEKNGWFSEEEVINKLKEKGINLR